MKEQFGDWDAETLPIPLSEEVLYGPQFDWNLKGNEQRDIKVIFDSIYFFKNSIHNNCRVTSVNFRNITVGLVSTHRFIYCIKYILIIRNKRLPLNVKPVLWVVLTAK